MREGLSEPRALAESVMRMRVAVDALRDTGYGAHLTLFLWSLAGGLAAAGDAGGALAVVEDALAVCERNGEGWCLPELLRTKGEVVLQSDGPGAAGAAEALFGEAIALARRQGALAWELRAATSLARLLQRAGRVDAARAALAPVYAQLKQGLATADPAAAASLLSALSTE